MRAGRLRSRAGRFFELGCKQRSATADQHLATARIGHSQLPPAVGVQGQSRPSVANHHGWGVVHDSPHSGSDNIRRNPPPQCRPLGVGRHGRPEMFTSPPGGGTDSPSAQLKPGDGRADVLRGRAGLAGRVPADRVPLGGGEPERRATFRAALIPNPLPATTAKAAPAYPASETRNRTRSAVPAGVRSLLAGVWATPSSRISGVIQPVSIGPGFMTFARMPRPPARPPAATRSGPARAMAAPKSSRSFLRFGPAALIVSDKAQSLPYGTLPGG